MGNGLIDNLALKMDKLTDQIVKGKISQSEYETLSKSYTTEELIIKSITDVIDLKQKILSAQGRDDRAYDGINVFMNVKIDPREEFHKCKEQYKQITAKECYSWSREADNKEKCGDCEWYDKVGKIFE